MGVSLCLRVCRGYSSWISYNEPYSPRKSVVPFVYEFLGKCKVRLKGESLTSS